MFVNYVSSLSSQKGRSVDYVVVEQWSRGLLLRKDNLLLKIALVTTQTIFVNGKPKIFFDEQAVKNLKMEFKIMQHLFTSIVEELRRDNNLRLRVPPIIYF